MPEVYVSKNIENGKMFDTLIGNLLAYKPGQWGYSEQDYTKIASDFNVASNNLYYLPNGNYKMINLPNSPFNSDFVNITVLELSTKKVYVANIGGSETYALEMTSETSSISWIDITKRDAGSSSDSKIFVISDVEPDDTTKLWIDISKKDIENEITMRWYNGTSWISYGYEKNDLEWIKTDDIHDYTIRTSDIAYGKGKYIVPSFSHTFDGSEIIYYSTDGIIWSQTTTDSVLQWGGVCYGGNKYVIAGGKTVTYSVDGLVWTESSDGLSSAPAGISRIHYGDSKYIGLSNDYTVYSINGLSWVVVEHTDLQRFYLELCYGNGKYVASDTYVTTNILPYSTDGISWTLVSSGLSEQVWHSYYGNGKFIAVSEQSNIFAYSTDGISWTEVSTGLSNQYWYSACYGDNGFVVLPDGNVYAHSTDGIVWVEKPMIDGNWLSVCYGQDKYVSVSFTDNFLAYSALETGSLMQRDIYDSKNRKEDPYELVLSVVNDFVYGCNEFDAHINNQLALIHLTEDEKSAFEFLLTPDYVANYFSKDGDLYEDIVNSIDEEISSTVDITSQTDKYETVKSVYDDHLNGNGTTPKHITNDDVLSWDNKAVVDHTHYLDGNVIVKPENIMKMYWKETKNGLQVLSWERMIYGDRFITTATSSTDKIFYSDDGINWNTGSTGASDQYRIFCYGNGKYIAGTINTHNVFISTDGIYWDLVGEALNTGGSLDCGAYGASKYVILTNINHVYSSDGLSWTILKIDEGERIDVGDVCYSNGKFVAVGFNTENLGKFAYSTDGLTWTLTSNGLEGVRSCHSVCYGNGIYVTIYSGTIIYSSDGINWTQIATYYTEGQTYYSIVYGDDGFLSFRMNSNECLYSKDGFEWTLIIANVPVTRWQCSAYGQGIYVTANNNSDTFIYTNGVENFSLDQLSSEIKERAIKISTLDDLSQQLSQEELGDKYHNGNILYISNEDGTERWWKIIDNTKFGTPHYEEGVKLLYEAGSNGSYSFNDISDTPTTVAGYGIIDAATEEEVIQTVGREGCTTYEIIPDGYAEKVSINYLDFDFLTFDYNGDICYGNNGFIAISLSNKFAKSDNGFTWDTQKFCNESINTIDALCYGNNKYVVLPMYSERSLYSTDGVNWLINENFISGLWDGVCYDNGKYVAVEVLNELSAYSIDGINWTSSTIGTHGSQWHSICYGNNKFVVVGNDDYVAYSSNGINWSVVDIGDNIPSCSYVCYGNDKFVAVGIGSYIMYSTDGIAWTGQKINSDNRYWESICYGNGKYVVVASTADNHSAYSSDGVNWTETIISETIADWSSICYGDNKFIACANSAYYAYSNDGVSWEDVNSSEVFIHSDSLEYYVGVQKTLLESGGNDNHPDYVSWKEVSISSTGLENLSFRDTCYGNGKFILTGNHSSFGYSMDGLAWVAVDVTNRNWMSCCYGGGKFVVTSNTNIFVYSSDGISWTETTSNLESLQWQAASYGGGKFVAVPYYSDRIAYSTNGIVWTMKNGLTNTGRYDIVYGSGKFVCISERMFSYSSDGITWTETTDGLNERYWRWVCYGSDMNNNTKFVACTLDDNVFAYSTNGINWTETIIGLSKRSWNDVCYGRDLFENNIFVAIAYDTNIFAYSTDGISWMEITNRVSENRWYSICYNDKRFITIPTNDDDRNVILYGVCAPSDIQMSTEHSDLDIILACGYNPLLALSKQQNVTKMHCEYPKKTYTNSYESYNCSEMGLSHVVNQNISALNYFKNIYETDEQNPNWIPYGLGRMLKVDTSRDNTVISETYDINGNEYNVNIEWDTKKGLVFKIVVDKALKSANEVCENFVSQMDNISTAIEGVNSLLT